VTDQPAAATETQAPGDEKTPKFKTGDLVWVTNKFHAFVIRIFPNYDTAVAEYDRGRWPGVMKRGQKWDKGDFHYLCEIANSTRQHIGGCESEMRLKNPPKEEPKAEETAQ
jgi:hypothetical protein